MADPTMLKRLHTMELKMADALLSFCKKNNLRIWADSGTLLGAIRHGGFIPWDDDMDFVMFRNDFDKLKEIIKTEHLPKPYHFEVGLAQIRVCNEGTTMFSNNARYPNSHGAGNGGNVWIDIFCMDNLPKVDLDFSKQWRYIFQYDRPANNKKAMSFETSRGIVGKCWHFACLLCNVKKREDFVDLFCKQYQDFECETVSKLALYLRMGRYRDAVDLPIYSRHWYDDTVYKQFGSLSLPCPQNYDSVLRIMYGDDYMTPRRNPSVHGDVVIDLDRPYEEVVQEMLSKMPFWKRFMVKH